MTTEVEAGEAATIEPVRLVSWDDPVLLAPAPKFDTSVSEAVELEDRLLRGLAEQGGLGLSACQIGVSVRAFALKTNPAAVMFNPRIVDRTSEDDEMEEGCLSFPGLVVRVPRAKAIKVRFLTSDGQTQNEKYHGMTARIIQHELDHLNGRVFFDHLGRTGLELAVRRAAKYGYNYPVGKLWMIAKKSLENARD
jgi:peptide deformylase